MNEYYLNITVVPRGKSMIVTKAAVMAGCSGGTVIGGRGISRNGLAVLLGFGEFDQDIIINLVEKDRRCEVQTAIKVSCSSQKKFFGGMFSLKAQDFVKGGNIYHGETKMDLENSEENKDKMTHELIVVIVNKDFADDVMHAARKAGAGGGTVINARGTAREEDAKFFGVQIVPEKEMLMILVDSDKKEKVLESIRNLKCISQPGSGIAFTLPATDFTVLGKSAGK